MHDSLLDLLVLEFVLLLEWLLVVAAIEFLVVVEGELDGLPDNVLVLLGLGLLLVLEQLVHLGEDLLDDLLLLLRALLGLSWLLLDLSRVARLRRFLNISVDGVGDLLPDTFDDSREDRKLNRIVKLIATVNLIGDNLRFVVAIVLSLSDRLAAKLVGIKHLVAADHIVLEVIHFIHGWLRENWFLVD